MDKITLPRQAKPRPAAGPAPEPRRQPEPRDDLARPITTTTQLAELVRELRTALAIGQSELATRAGVGRHWIGELEHGKPTLEIDKVLRVLMTLGFEIVLTPYDPPPPWMLRACAFAAARTQAAAEARRVQRNTRRSRARLRRLAANARPMMVDVE